MPATLLKKCQAQIFSCEFCEIFKNTCYSTSGRLLLNSTIAAAEKDCGKRDLFGLMLNLHIGLSSGNQVIVAWHHNTVLKKTNRNHIAVKSTDRFIQNVMKFRWVDDFLWSKALFDLIVRTVIEASSIWQLFYSCHCCSQLFFDVTINPEQLLQRDNNEIISLCGSPL